MYDTYRCPSSMWMLSFGEGMEKSMKNAYIAERRVFPIFCCPGKLFIKMFKTPKFSISIGFMMAHFEDQKHGKTIESPKSNVVKGQMSAIL